VVPNLLQGFLVVIHRFAPAKNARPPLTLALLALAISGATARQAEAQSPSGAGAPQTSQAEARRLSDAFVSVAERVSPSVVQIDVSVRDESADQVLRWMARSGGGDSPVAHGTGSGVVFTADGAILTNNHVVDEALAIDVHLRDGRLLPARLIGRDPSTDLAVIKVEAQGLVAARFADSEAARVGEWVVAIGSPFGLGYTVTAGVLSAKGRGSIGMNEIEDYLQTDASINPGNSGGPLCNLDGQVIGINSMIVGRGSGIGFAVPSALARRAAEQILRTGRVERAWVGVHVQDLTPSLAAAFKLDPRAGALVNSVSEGSPAESAQIHPGDVLASVAGKPVHDGRDLIRQLMAHEVGESVQLEVIRGGQHYGTNIVLVARPEPPVPTLPVQQQGVPHPQGLGLGVRDLSPQQSASLGLPARSLPMVSTVVPGSPADRAGLRTGDVIVEVDGIAMPTSEQLQQSAADGQLLLRLRRQGQAFYAALRR
jgi:S1-C subfamily serine protease